MDWTIGSTLVKSSRSVYVLHLVQSCYCTYLNTEGVTMLTGFPRTKWPQWRFSESYAAWISAKILWICEFCVTMGIWLVCQGIVHPALLGAGWMITSKPSLRLGFDCIIRPAPSGAGWTTPPQPGHYSLTVCMYHKIRNIPPNMLPMIRIWKQSKQRCRPPVICNRQIADYFWDLIAH